MRLSRPRLCSAVLTSASKARLGFEHVSPRGLVNQSASFFDQTRRLDFSSSYVSSSVTPSPVLSFHLSLEVHPRVCQRVWRVQPIYEKACVACSNRAASLHTTGTRL